MTGAVTADGWSAYDDATPHPGCVPGVIERAAALRTLRDPADEASLSQIAEVVVVVSASRGGSTLFGELLRRVPGLLHLSAEINPLFTLAGLHDGAERRRVLEAELLRDIGTPAPPGPIHQEQRRRLVHDLAWRLTLQWPFLSKCLELNELVDLVEGVVPPVGAPYEAHAAQVEVVRRLDESGAAVDPGYYDLPGSALSDTDRPHGPPNDVVIEMPPFVTVDRWIPASAHQLGTQPLVLSTPRCSFRLEFIRDLFPSAELRVVHLSRNPAASVNGLIDGWLHHGFFNCPVPGGLAIDGYSAEVPGGDAWWCFDFPPGWEDWVTASLEDVCAFQWAATHWATIEGCERLDLEALRIQFEDVVGDNRSRRRVCAELAPVLGVTPQSVADAMLDLPVVMATSRPRPARWRTRGPILNRALESPGVLELADRLGYARDRTSWL